MKSKMHAEVKDKKRRFLNDWMKLRVSSRLRLGPDSDPGWRWNENEWVVKLIWRPFW